MDSPTTNTPRPVSTVPVFDESKAPSPREFYEILKEMGEVVDKGTLGVSFQVSKLNGSQCQAMFRAAVRRMSSKRTVAIAVKFFVDEYDGVSYYENTLEKIDNVFEFHEHVIMRHMPEVRGNTNNGRTTTNDPFSANVKVDRLLCALREISEVLPPKVRLRVLYHLLRAQR